LPACLQEARGGDIAVREGVVSQRPAVTVQPADVTVDEGGNAQLSIVATVSSTQEHLMCQIKYNTLVSKPLSSALSYAAYAVEMQPRSSAPTSQAGHAFCAMHGCGQSRSSTIILSEDWLCLCRCC
jgi:hypothetical protein